MGELLNVREAKKRLLDRFSPVGIENLMLSEGSGRILGEDIYSSLDLPPFPNSAMDGFAVRTADLPDASLVQPARLPVIADIPAGWAGELILNDGQAARIMTGAPVPPGADAVVPVEQTDFNDRGPGLDAPEFVQIYRRPQIGDNIRPAGQDVRAGELVLNTGLCLRPQDLGFLSMLGVAQIVVQRKPRVVIFSTGDELVPVDVKLTPGKIHDANSYVLTAQVESIGGQPIPLGIIADREDAVQKCLDQAVELQADLILSSAGVSVGAFDFVRSVVERRGGLDFWRVNMRPGKPIAFGNYLNIPFIGLPGNPVSTFVGFEVFVRPAILKMGGRPVIERTTRQVLLAGPIESDGRQSYLRARVTNQEGQLIAHLTGHQGSGNLRSLVEGNALLVIPSGVKSLPSGSRCEAWLFDE